MKNASIDEPYIAIIENNIVTYGDLFFGSYEIARKINSIPEALSYINEMHSDDIPILN